MIKAGDSIFRSTGVAVLRVTREGREQWLEFAIQSYDISDPTLRAIRDAKPRPPVKRRVIHPGDPEAEELGIRGERAFVSEYDYADNVYLEKVEEWRNRLGYATVLAGLAERFEEGDGREVTDPQRKIEILRETGFNHQHFAALSEQISALSNSSMEEREAYFRRRDGRPGSDSPAEESGAEAMESGGAPGA